MGSENNSTHRGAQSQIGAFSEPGFLPHNYEAEQAVLGAILIDDSVCYRVYEKIAPGDFHHEAHRYIYKAMQDITESGQTVDLITLEDALRKYYDMGEKYGGFPYLRKLMDTAIPAQVMQYAGMVQEYSQLRTLMAMSRDVYHSASNSERCVSEIIESMDSALARLRGTSGTGPVLVGTLVDAEREKLLERSKTHERLVGIQTPLDGLDFLTGGWQEKTLTILAARPSVGKTSFALQCADKAAKVTGQPVLFVSLEMSKEELVVRLICSKAQIDFGRFKTAYLSQDEWERVEMAAESIAETPLWIDDNSELTVSGIRNSLHKIVSQTGCRCAFVVVDYLQIISSGMSNRGESEVEKHGRVANELKRMAKSESIPVMALAQLNREVEHRPDKRPQLSDLHGSGKIEAEADTVMMLYNVTKNSRSRDDDDGEQTGATEKVEIIVNKQRNGSIGVVDAAFEPRYTRFSDFENRWEEY